MKTQCVNFTVREGETSNEIQSLKFTIDQMSSQYSELSEKFAENEKNLKYFEQRDIDQSKQIEKLKLEIDLLNKPTSKQDMYAKTFIENGQPIEIKQPQQQLPPFVKSPIRSSLIVNPNKPQMPLTNLIQEFNQHQNFAQEIMICQQQSDENAHTFGALNRATPILDNEPSKSKSSLIKRGSLASRHLPHQPTHIDEAAAIEMKSAYNVKYNDLNGDEMDDEEDRNTSTSLDAAAADDNTIYKLRILNGNQINTPANYHMNNQIQMPLNTDISLSAHTSTSTTTNTATSSSSTSMSTAASSFCSTYANTTQNQHTVSFTQPIEGKVNDD